MPRFGPAHIGVGNALQRERQRLDDEIIDRKLVGRLAVFVLRRGGVDLLARGHQPADIAIDRVIEMRNGLHRGGQPLRDGAAHAVMRHDFVAAFLIERADLLIGHRRRDRGRRAAGGSRAGARKPLPDFAPLDIAGDDAAMRSRALHAAEVETGLFRQPAGKRRGEDAVGAGPAAERCLGTFVAHARRAERGRSRRLRGSARRLGLAVGLLRLFRFARRFAAAALRCRSPRPSRPRLRCASTAMS